MFHAHSVRARSIFTAGGRQPDGRDNTCMPLAVCWYCRGKSGLHRVGCQVTPGHVRRELRVTDSATENKPPRCALRCFRGKGEMVG